MSAPGRRVLYCDGETSGVRRMVDGGYPHTEARELAFVTDTYNSIKGWQSIIFPTYIHHWMYFLFLVAALFALPFFITYGLRIVNCLISSI